MSTQPEALLALAGRIEEAQGKPIAIDPQAAAELRRLHVLNQELLEALQTILNISLMDKGHWAKTIEAEAHAAIAKATGADQQS